MTAKDVAQHAGVSQATVSYVLNQNENGRVAAQTRERVLQSALALGYQPDLIARSMRTGRSGLLALIVSNFSNPVYPLWAQRLQLQARARGLDLLIYASPDTGQLTEAVVPLLGRRVDGAILVGLQAGQGDLNRLLGASIPLVTIGGSIRHPDIDLVTTDNAEAMRLVVRHLVAGGRRRIGHLTGRLSSLTGQERLRGYEEGVRAAGLPLLVKEGNYAADSVRALVQQWLGEDERPDAIVAANDVMAIEAVLTLQDAGLRVPEDVAVTGMDDIPAAQWLRPKLTTVRGPLGTLEAEVVRLLWERLEGYEGAGRQVVLPPELVPRESA